MIKEQASWRVATSTRPAIRPVRNKGRRNSRIPFALTKQEQLAKLEHDKLTPEWYAALDSYKKEGDNNAR